MADIEELVRLLKELEQDLERCTRCGMCQAVCPLYCETGRESDVARGKIVLLENLGREILDDPGAVKQRLDKCLLCGSCASVCPAGLPVSEIFLKARVLITGYLGLSPVKKAVFRIFLSNPERFDAVLGWISRFQGLFSKNANKTLGSSCARFVSPVIRDRHFVPVAKSAWHQNAHRPFAFSRSSGRIRAVFYPGCLVDKLLPRVADAAMKVFAFHGVDVFVPSRVPCCGIPALAAGDQKTFETLVEQNIRMIDGLDYDYLITPCATCTSTIRKLWPSMTRDLCNKFSGDVLEKITAVSEKTLDINEFVADKLGVRASEESSLAKNTVTWHDPCHLKKNLGIYKQPRTILAAAGGLRFIEMREPDRCCGMGGSFNLEHYELSKKIGRKKLKDISDTGADYVATGCPACMLQIIDLLSHAGHNTEVKHAIELYAEALDERSAKEGK